jgi:hypothetical protein
MPKNIWKRVNKQQVLVTTLKSSIEDSDIEQELYNTSDRKNPEYYPSYIYIISRKGDDYFVDLLFDILNKQPKERLEDQDYVDKLFTNISKYFKKLTKDEYINALNFVKNPSSLEYKNLILEQDSQASEEDSSINLSELEDISTEDTDTTVDKTKPGESLLPVLNILRFSCNLGKLYENVDLNQLYSTFTLSKDFILAKTLKDKDPEFLTEGLSAKKNRKIDFFIYSEHNKEKIVKVLVSGQIRLLVYDEENDIKIEVFIADTGFVSCKIETESIRYTNYNLKQRGIKETIQKIYKHLTPKDLDSIEFKDFFVKIIYPASYGFIPKKTVSLAEKTFIKNEKVFIEDLGIYYSSKNFKMNFTPKSSYTTIEQAKEESEKIYKRVEYYFNNFTVIEDLQIHESPVEEDNVKYSKVTVKTKYIHYATDKFKFLKLGSEIYKITGFSDKIITILATNPKNIKVKNYLFSNSVKKQTIKEMREVGLVINPKECEKKRRPVLLPKNDKSQGDNILELNGRKFKCLPPYGYHGLVGKTNCCFINKTIPVDEQETDDIKTAILRKGTPLKTYNFKKKYEIRTIPNNLDDYIGEKYSLLNIADRIYDRTIQECIKNIYGKDIIINSIQDLSEENYKLFGKNDNVETWKSTESKSIDDIILAVSLFKKVNIHIVLDDTVEGLKVTCKSKYMFNKYLIIYKSDEKKEAYYPVIYRDLQNKDVIYEHQEEDIQDFINMSKNACRIGFSKSLSDYSDITKTQITDFQDLVVFVEIIYGGYIPVNPTTVDSRIPSYSINSSQFKLQSPEDQYNSLKEASKKYINLEPVELTMIYDTDIITGIKLKNGQVSPVYHSRWVGSPLPKSSDLFYIEKYSSPEEYFFDEEELFKNNLQNIKNSITDNQRQEINNYIKTEEYMKIIDIVKTFDITSVDEISRITWYLINNEYFF